MYTLYIHMNKISKNVFVFEIHLYVFVFVIKYMALWSSCVCITHSKKYLCLYLKTFACTWPQACTAVMIQWFSSHCLMLLIKPISNCCLLHSNINTHTHTHTHTHKTHNYLNSLLFITYKIMTYTWSPSLKPNLSASEFFTT